jgi:putative ABC transport system permease protein
MGHYRYAIRLLLRNPLFTTSAIGVLALGIAANTAIFSVLDAVLLRPLPYRDSDRLVLITEVIPPLAHLYPTVPVNAHHFATWHAQARSFEQLTALRGLVLNLTGTGEPVRLGAAGVSWDFFSMLGEQPMLGRTFRADEDRPGRDHVVLISHELWENRFGRDSRIIGRTILLDGAPYEVVGVLSPQFFFAHGEQLHHLIRLQDRVDAWKPIAFTDDELSVSAGDFDYGVIGRLRLGTTQEQALAELNVLQAQLARSSPEPIELRADVRNLQDAMTSGSRRPLVLLMGAVAVVLLIGCVNVANLLLVRATVRSRELAIRTALGAGRGHIIRQLLTESLLLATTGGAIGVVLASWTTSVIVRQAPGNLPAIDRLAINGRVLMFTTLVSLLTGFLCGIVPAWRYSLMDPHERLRDGSRGTAAHGHRTRTVLVAAEVALTMLLLVSAGLLVRSFIAVWGVDRGFEIERQVTVQLALPQVRYADKPRRTAFVDALLPHVLALPGVTAAGVTNVLPLGGEHNVSPISIEGTTVPMLERPIANIRSVTPGYFAAQGIRLIKGRVFGDEDRQRRVAVISESIATRVWPGETAIGKRYREGDDQSPLIEVVGVVGDVRGVSLEMAPGLVAYVPYWQRPQPTASLVVRTLQEPDALVQALRREIWRVDPDVPVPKVSRMTEIVSASTAARRFQLLLIGGFAAAALLLAAIGIFGTVSYAVTQRRGEIGVRLALGATRYDVHRLVVGQGLRPVISGLTFGALASAVTARAMQGLLFGVKPTDVPTFVTVPLVLLAVALVACAWPALRASHIDPLVMLRTD